MKKVMVMTILAVFVICFSSTANAMVSGQLKNLEVKSVRYSTNIHGTTNLKDVYVRGTTDQTVMRMMIITLTANAPEGQQVLFGREFMLKYEHNGRETRAHCMGIAGNDADLSPATFFLTDIFNEPALTLNGSQVSFSLLFFVENIPSSFTLYRAGTENTISFYSAERKLSVYLLTNSMTASELAQLKQLIVDSGCEVLTSNELDSSVSGVIVHYMPRAESAAREISQRLMTKIENPPTVKECGLITSYDIIIWIGKGSKLKKISF